MKVSAINPQNKNRIAFQSRNAEIRFADDILRRINNEFPRISTSRHYDTIGDINKLSKEQADYLKTKTDFILKLRNLRPNEYAKPLDFYNHLFQSIKLFKLGNCSESAFLGKIGLAINNIKSTKVALYGHSKKFGSIRLDHSIDIANFNPNAKWTDPKTYGKNAYSFDLWDGFVDYLPNALKRYEADYANDKRMKFVDKLIVMPADFNIDENTITEIGKKYPQLKINRK